MERRTLGRTGLDLGVLGLGGHFLSTLHGTKIEDSRRTVRRALELGMNCIDTAPSYGDSEHVLGVALEGVELPCIVSTKLGGRPSPFDAKDKDGLRRSVEESLRLLKRDTIDILMIHEPDRVGAYDWWTDRNAYEGPVNDLLDELKEEGVIRFTGLGGITAYELANIVGTGRYDVVITGLNYSLLWREATISLIPAAKRHNVGLIIGAPAQGGALARRYDDAIKHGVRWMSPPRRAQFQALYRLLDEIDIPLPELSLRFALSNPDVSLILTGATSVEEVEQNVRAIDAGPLPADLLSQVDEIADMVPFRPTDEPMVLPMEAEHIDLGPLR